MLPTPVKTGPGGALSINIDNDSMGDLGKAFGSALKPLVKGIKDLNQTLIKSMAPDPESKTDRGKDLIKGPEGAKAKDDDLKKLNLLGLAAFGLLASYLTGFNNTLQGLVNLVNLNKITKALKKPFLSIGKGLASLRLLFTRFGERLKKIRLQRIFGKAGIFDRFLLRMADLGKSVRVLLTNAKTSVQGFFKGGIISKFFTSIGNFVDRIKSFNPQTLRLQASFGQGGALGKFLLGFKKVVDGVKGFLAPIANVTKSIGGGIATALKSLGGVVKFVGTIGRFISRIPVIGTLLVPLFAIIDGVTGFMEGFKDKGILDGILTGLGNILGGLIGAPLDLLKGVLAFVLDKIGLKGIADALKDFSFKDFIKNIFGGIVNFFENIPKFIEGALRGLGKIGNMLADKMFGKDSEGAAKSMIQDASKQQASAEKDITGVGGVAGREKIEAEQQAKIDAMPEGKPKQIAQENLDRRKKFTEKMKLEADAKMQEGAIKGLALKTKDIDTAKMLAEGATAEQVFEKTKDLQATLTPKELEMFKQQVENQAGLGIADLAKESVSKQQLLGSLTGKEAMTAEQIALQEQVFADKAKLARAGKTSLETTAKMVDGKVVEGQTLDDISAPIVSSNIGGSSTDNSTTDNSSTNNTNNQTNNYYGGDGGAGMNSTNPDSSLFQQHGTYAP